MSRNAKKGAEKLIKSSLTKVFMMNKQLISDNDFNELNIVQIQLPRKLSTFIESDSIFEVLQFNENNRSWFLDDTVCSNGKFFVSSKIDPLFIFIQFLEFHCKDRAQPLDQIMGEAEIFIKHLKTQQMKLVADQKGPEDLKAFVYNEEKTLKWLKKKFELIKTSLRCQHLVTSGASSLNYVKTSADNEEVDEDAISEAALGIISEYISLDLIEKLDEFYGISEKSKEPMSQKRKSEVSNSDVDRKRIKIEEQENLLVSPTNPASKSKVTTKSKALEKAAKGTKSINSFFTKK